MEELYKGIKHVIYINPDISAGCEHCDKFIEGKEFAESVNHYLDKHGYRLLHVGSQTSRDSDGNLWNETVAVLGK